MKCLSASLSCACIVFLVTAAGCTVPAEDDVPVDGAEEALRRTVDARMDERWACIDDFLWLTGCVAPLACTATGPAGLACFVAATGACAAAIANVCNNHCGGFCTVDANEYEAVTKKSPSSSSKKTYRRRCDRAKDVCASQ